MSADHRNGSPTTESPEELAEANRPLLERIAESDLPIAPDAQRILELIPEDEDEE